MLVSSGLQLKLWSTETFQLLQDVTMESSTEYSQLSWSKDGQLLASLCPKLSEVPIRIAGNNSLSDVVDIFKMDKKPQCLQFARTNAKYLAIGGEDTIVIWDTKAKTKKKTFTPPAKDLVRLNFSMSDSHIAGATKQGDVHIMSVVNNALVGSFKLFRSSPITDLRFSPSKRSLLAASSQCGSIGLMDIFANEVVKRLTGVHNAPASSIAFSPTNDLLLASVGYDKKLITYDVRSKKEILRHQYGQPLTSICFLESGNCVALGSMVGDIIIADLRSLDTPVATMKTNHSPVFDLIVRPRRTSKASSAGRTATNERTNRSLTKIEASRDKVSSEMVKSSQNIKDSCSPLMANDSHVSPSLHILSPIKQDNEKENVSAEVCPSEISSKMQLTDMLSNASDSNVTSLVRDTATDPTANFDDILSPVKDTSIASMLSVSPGKRTKVDWTDGILSPAQSAASTNSNKSPSPVKYPTPSSDNTPIIKQPLLDITDLQNRLLDCHPSEGLQWENAPLKVSRLADEKKEVGQLDKSVLSMDKGKPKVHFRDEDIKLDESSMNSHILSTNSDQISEQNYTKNDDDISINHSSDNQQNMSANMDEIISSGRSLAKSQEYCLDGLNNKLEQMCRDSHKIVVQLSQDTTSDICSQTTSELDFLESKVVNSKVNASALQNRKDDTVSTLSSSGDIAKGEEISALKDQFGVASAERLGESEVKQEHQAKAAEKPDSCINLLDLKTFIQNCFWEQQLLEVKRCSTTNWLLLEEFLKVKKELSRIKEQLTSMSMYEELLEENERLRAELERLRSFY